MLPTVQFSRAPVLNSFRFKFSDLYLKIEAYVARLFLTEASHATMAVPGCLKSDSISLLTLFLIVSFCLFVSYDLGQGISVNSKSIYLSFHGGLEYLSCSDSYSNGISAFFIIESTTAGQLR